MQATVESGDQSTTSQVSEIVMRARAAQRAIETYRQADIDELITGLAWSVYQPDHASRLAVSAVDETGLGRVNDKIAKNQMRTLGALSDLLGERSVGIVEEDAFGVTTYAKPVGVVGAVLPSTHPAAVGAVKALLVVKGANSIVFAPSPKGVGTCRLMTSYMREELGRLGAPLDLVQCLPAPATRSQTKALMEQCDRVAVTASQANVQLAYRSGTPAIGTATGNVVVLVDRSANISDAAKKIAESKTFDYGTSCSSESVLLVESDVYDGTLEELQRNGGYVLSAREVRDLKAVLWQDGILNRDLVAKPPRVIANAAKLSGGAYDAGFFIVEQGELELDPCISGEKLSVVLAVYRARSFHDALSMLERIIELSGIGHSCGIHTTDFEHAKELAATAKVSNVLVNQAHALSNTGSFETGLRFTSSVPCGSWAKNSSSGSVRYQDFLNFTRLIRPLPRQKPTEESVFGNYRRKYGT